MIKKNTEIVRTTSWSAGPGCHGGCGILVHIKDGKLIKIEGDPDHLWSHSRLCARDLAMNQYPVHSDRLRCSLEKDGQAPRGQMAADILG
jgi:anaerobic selenocysteine-containing dehydrogenase